MSSPTSFEAPLTIPSVEPSVTLAGILHRKSTASPTSSFALIIHGTLAHKNQCYHKLLAATLPIDSIRIDLRGNADSGGEWGPANFAQDMQDIQASVAYARATLGYTGVDLLVAHSRGCLASWLYVGRDEALRWDERDDDTGAQQQAAPKLVVASGRYNSAGVLNRDIAANVPATGYFTWKVRVAGQPRSYRVYLSDLQRMARFPTNAVVRRCPPDVPALILHGTVDQAVPHQDAHGFFETLKEDARRKWDMQELHFVEGADHQFKGHYDEVVQRIVGWYDGKMASGVKELQQGAGNDAQKRLLRTAQEKAAHIKAKPAPAAQQPQRDAHL